ncbi:MAG: hypothetical protein WDZ91_16930 [Paenibacillaceae bacterium]
MEIARTMETVEDILKHDFKYLYKKKRTGINAWHMTFFMDSKTHNLQLNFDFQEHFCDILSFISPPVLTIGSENYWEALQTVNYANCYAKAAGRFYIDSYGDLAYSHRLHYDVLESMPHKCAKEVEAAIDYYSDLFVAFLDVCQGKRKFEDTKQFIDDMWGGMLYGY